MNGTTPSPTATAARCEKNDGTTADGKGFPCVVELYVPRGLWPAASASESDQSSDGIDANEHAMFAPSLRHHQREHEREHDELGARRDRHHERERGERVVSSRRRRDRHVKGEQRPDECGVRDRAGQQERSEHQPRHGDGQRRGERGRPDVARDAEREQVRGDRRGRDH